MNATSGDETPRANGSTRRRALGAGLVALAVAVLVTVLVLTLGDSEGDERDELATAGPSATPSATKAARKPAAEPTEVVPRQKLGKPERAGLDDEVQVADGIDVQIEDIESVRGVGRGPGETSGPALRVGVAVANDSGEPLDLALAQVNLFFGPDEAPAGVLSGPGVRPFPTQLAPDEDVEGVFVFAVPADARDRVRVDFTYSTEAPRVVFTGAVDG